MKTDSDTKMAFYTYAVTPARGEDSVQKDGNNTRRAASHHSVDDDGGYCLSVAGVRYCALCASVKRKKPKHKNKTSQSSHLESIDKSSL